MDQGGPYVTFVSLTKTLDLNPNRTPAHIPLYFCLFFLLMKTANNCLSREGKVMLGNVLRRPEPSSQEGNEAAGDLGGQSPGQDLSILEPGVPPEEQFRGRDSIQQGGFTQAWNALLLSPGSSLGSGPASVL